MRSHRDLKAFACNFCKKAFTSQAYLKTHTKVIHDQIKEHSCSLCYKKFPSKRNLACHMRVRTGEKPFKCPNFFHSFANESFLRRNLKIHNRKVL